MLCGLVVNKALILERDSAHIVGGFSYVIAFGSEVYRIIVTCRKSTERDRVSTRVVTRLASKLSDECITRNKSHNVVGKLLFSFTVNCIYLMGRYLNSLGSNIEICQHNLRRVVIHALGCKGCNDFGFGNVRCRTCIAYGNSNSVKSHGKLSRNNYGFLCSVVRYGHILELNSAHIVSCFIYGVGCGGEVYRIVLIRRNRSERDLVCACVVAKLTNELSGKRVALYEVFHYVSEGYVFITVGYCLSFRGNGNSSGRYSGISRHNLGDLIVFALGCKDCGSKHLRVRNVGCAARIGNGNLYSVKSYGKLSRDYRMLCGLVVNKALIIERDSAHIVICLIYLADRSRIAYFVVGTGSKRSKYYVVLAYVVRTRFSKRAGDRISIDQSLFHVRKS